MDGLFGVQSGIMRGVRRVRVRVRVNARARARVSPSLGTLPANPDPNPNPNPTVVLVRAWVYYRGNTAVAPPLWGTYTLRESHVKVLYVGVNL